MRLKAILNNALGNFDKGQGSSPIVRESAAIPIIHVTEVIMIS